MTEKKIPIHRLERADKFVRVHKLSGGNVGILLSDFLEWQKALPRPNPPKDDNGCRHG